MFLLPALGAWITDGLVLYIYFSNTGINSTQISPGVNNNLNVDLILCGHGSHCRQGFALDDVLDDQSLEITDDKIIHRSVLQLTAAEDSTAPKNDSDDSQSNNRKMGISVATI